MSLWYWIGGFAVVIFIIVMARKGKNNSGSVKPRRTFRKTLDDCCNALGIKK